MKYIYSLLICLLITAGCSSNSVFERFHFISGPKNANKLTILVTRENDYLNADIRTFIELEAHKSSLLLLPGSSCPETIAVKSTCLGWGVIPKSGSPSELIQRRNESLFKILLQNISVYSNIVVVVGAAQLFGFDQSSSISSRMMLFNKPTLKDPQHEFRQFMNDYQASVWLHAEAVQYVSGLP